MSFHNENIISRQRVVNSMPYFLFDDPHPGNWHNHLCYFSSSFLILGIMDICCLFTAVVFSSIRHIFIDVVIWHMKSLLTNGLFLGSPSLLFSAVVYSSVFCQAFHKRNLIWWSVPIGGILRLSLGWANCGSALCSLCSHQLSRSRRQSPVHDDVLIDLVDHSGMTPFLLRLLWNTSCSREPSASFTSRGSRTRFFSWLYESGIKDEILLKN